MSGFFDSPNEKISIPLSLVPKCGACGFYKECSSPKMTTKGKGKRKILVVVDYPTGDDRNRFFSQELEEWTKQKFDEAGLDLYRDCWITGALICKPTRRHEKKEVTQHCRPNLMKMIRDLKPTTVILMGEYALEILRHLWKDEGLNIDKWVGFQIPAQKINAWVCPTYSPSFLSNMNNRVLDLFFVRQLIQARKKSKKGKPYEKVPDYPSQVQVCYHDRPMYEFLNSLKRGDSFAFDYETTMLKPEHPDARITHVSFSNGIKTVVSPWHPNWGLIEPLKAIMRDKEIKKIASNMKFEHRWTKNKVGCDVRGWGHDTMLAAHILDNRGDIASIKIQAFIHLGQPEWDGHIKQFLKSKAKGGYGLNNIHNAPQQEIMVYCGMDSLMEYKVAEIQKQLLCKEEM